MRSPVIVFALALGAWLVCEQTFAASRFGSFSLAPGESKTIFVDPPYDTADADVTAVLAALTVPGRLAPDAIVSVERPYRHRVIAPPGLETGWERTFGDTLLTFLFA